MDRYVRPYRWTALLAALIVAAAVGYFAYNAGVAHGIAAAGQQVAAPVPGVYPYGWYRPWGFGFFFAPFFFFLAFVVVMRALAFGGPWRRYGCYGRGAWDAPTAFDDWHRRAHDRMASQPGGPPRDDDRSRG